MYKMKIILFTLLVGLISCGDERTKEKALTETELLTELKSAPKSVTIGKNTFYLTTYLWRNFMPVAEENGGSMICVNSLTEKDSLSISGSIKLIKQYVIKENEVWAADYTEITKPNPYIIKGVVRDGPKWGPNIEVDIVCEFEQTGKIYRILAASQKINAVQ